MTLHIFWLSQRGVERFSQLSLQWHINGANLLHLRETLKTQPLPEGFPLHLLDEESAYTRWGQRLRWGSPLWMDDEIAILERISADAKQRRHDKVRRQRSAKL